MRNRNSAWTGLKALLALAGSFVATTPAGAQAVPAVPTPLRVESDPAGVNIDDGKTVMGTPVLSAPAAPNLRFDRVQNAAPYVVGNVSGEAGEIPVGNWSVHTGMGSSEAFGCSDWTDCDSVTGTGSTFRGPASSNGASSTFKQAGTGATWNFNLQHVTTGQTRQAYASTVSYPTGEVISYTYETAYLPAYPSRPFYRPTRVSSNLGYHITLTYQPGALGELGWNQVAQATLYNSAASTTPLQQLTYSGNTITDLAGRVYTCVCNNGLGTDVQATTGSLQLPGEGTPAVQVTPGGGGANPVVASVVRDGATYNYAYTNLRYYSLQGQSGWIYDRVTVTGPDGYNQVYNLTQNQSRNILTSSTDAINRTTSYQFDSAYRVTQITAPEGNSVSVLYDTYGNIISRTETPKSGSGLSPVTQTAGYTPCADPPSPVGNNVLCYRAIWSRDALNRQTDYVYNASGQITEQTEPADTTGVRRRTITEYATAPGGLSRPTVIRVCGVGTTCGTSAEIRTEFVYFDTSPQQAPWANTALPRLVRQVDGTTAQVIETAYTYDLAGRVLSVDGPLQGSDDMTFNRYDVLGRKIWEIGAVGANGLRTARRITYRDSDNQATLVENGTVTDPANPVLTSVSQTAYAYDARRNPMLETASAGGTTVSVVQRTFDNRNRLDCEARRMNPAIYGSLPASACTLGAAGSQGPDRITHNVYDNAGQLLQVQRAYGITTANGFPATLQQNSATYTYSANGKQVSVTDANGNRAEMTFDGFDRPRRWIFPHGGPGAPNQCGSPGAANPCDYEEYGYDLVSNRISLRRRDGLTLGFQYDNLNRLLVKTVPERSGLDPSNTRDIYYAYNLRNQPSETRFDSLSGDGISNLYDGFGRLTSTTSRTGTFAPALGYGYDDAGRRSRITHPDGQIFTYAYSPAGELTDIYQGTGTSVRIAHFSYNAQTRLEGRTEGAGGSSVAYGYDSVGRLASLTDSFAGGTGNVALTFGYNPAGQIITRTRSNDAYAWTGAWVGSRDYSVNGLNQYTNVGGAGYAYDANGNLTSDGSRTYTYDEENRLVAASGGVQLGYDPAGRLAWTTGSPNFTRFLYDGDALVAEYDYSGNLVRRYVHGSNSGADDPLVWYEGTGVANRLWLHSDHLGSIVAMTNDSGALAAINAYDEWGIPARDAQGQITNVGRFQYTGQAWLAELGMYHYKARIYSPTLGRFLQTDPVGYGDQINLYAYVGNDPVNRTDPTGMFTDTCGSRLGISASCSGATFLNITAQAGAIRSRKEAAAASSGSEGAAGSYSLINYYVQPETPPGGVAPEYIGPEVAVDHPAICPAPDCRDGHVWVQARGGRAERRRGGWETMEARQTQRNRVAWRQEMARLNRCGRRAWQRGVDNVVSGFETDLLAGAGGYATGVMTGERDAGIGMDWRALRRGAYSSAAGIVIKVGVDFYKGVMADDPSDPTCNGR